jgi:hypothetical protein
VLLCAGRCSKHAGKAGWQWHGHPMPWTWSAGKQERDRTHAWDLITLTEEEADIHDPCVACSCRDGFLFLRPCCSTNELPIPKVQRARAEKQFAANHTRFPQRLHGKPHAWRRLGSDLTSRVPLFECGGLVLLRFVFFPLVLWLSFITYLSAHVPGKFLDSCFCLESMMWLKTCGS